MMTVDTSKVVRPIDTEWGTALPPRPRHAITCHMPGWQTVVGFSKQDPTIIARFKDMYPRFILHRDIKQLIGAILQFSKADGKYCLPFPSRAAAAECRDFITTPNRAENVESLAPEDVQIRVFQLQRPVYCVFFPADIMPLAMSIWKTGGFGISSRLAEDALPHVAEMRELPESEITTVRENPAALQILRRNIADLLERAPVGPPRSSKVTADEVYLSQTGMTSILYTHQMLLKWRNSKSKSVLLGFPFISTIDVFTQWGPGLKFLPLGTELEALEEFLKSEAAAGAPVQCVFTEFPSNPLLVSSDLRRLRELADEFRFALIVDDTLSGFCSVDVLSVADVVISSLTKSFSCYSDVMGGSTVLNPSSALFSELKPIFDQDFRQELYARDAEALLHNSKNYLQGSMVVNNNAAKLTEYLQSKSEDPASVVAKVFYPSVSDTRSNYDYFMRPSTADFSPGYGCLLSVELESLETAIAFYENLHVHNSGHLGAHLTMALAYCRLAPDEKLAELAPVGLKVTQIRISVGLEDTDELLAAFEFAIQKAEEAKNIA